MNHPGDLYRVWVYLSETPLLWLTATLVAFAIGDAISLRFHRNPLANTVVIAAGLLIVRAQNAPGPRTRPISRARNSSTSCSARPRWRSACRSGATASRSGATSCR